jgi:filamentous hemagglutinin family protein
VLIRQQTSKAIINWNQFNIGPNEVTRFIQPSSSSIALNRIFDKNPSQIFGRLEANGSLILLNRNGILFGPNAQVNVNGLIASSLNLSNEQFLAGQYLFQGQIGNGLIQNFGDIHGGSNGVYLLAPQVVNSGIITSPEGTVALGAGTTAYLSQRPDGHGLMVEVQAPAGEARNLGQIFADGGHVSLAGFAVNQEGLIQANSVKEKNGVIELFAQQNLTITSGSRTLARGEDSQPSQGGTIIALSDKSTGTTRFEKGAVIDVSGGQQGGDGGFAEVSGAHLTMGGNFKAGAAQGSRGGTILIDPVDLIVDNNALLGFNDSNAAEIIFQADRNLTVESAFNPSENWQWSVPGGNGTLRFVAGNTIRFNDLFGGITIGDSSLTELFDPSSTVPTAWNIVAQAGQDIIFGQVVRQGLDGSGPVSRVINGGALMASGGANIELDAGRDIGFLPLALDGTGDGSAGLQGTISAIQGNISLKAGRNLISPMASESLLNFLPGGIRLEGKGNLNIEVGGDWLGGLVAGNNVGPGFLLTDGEARISVGGQIGTAQQYGAITVGKADVLMNAGKSIYWGLVQDKGLVESPLLSGLSTLMVEPTNRMEVTARTGNVHINPFLPGIGENPIVDLRAYYPATFSAKALDGNVIVENPLTFWPSSTGEITLLARRDLVGKPRTIVVSTGRNSFGHPVRLSPEGIPEAVNLNGSFLTERRFACVG